MRIVISGSEFITNGCIINLLRDYFYFGHWFRIYTSR